MNKIIWTLRAVMRDYSIIEVVEVCRGCQRQDCKPFRPRWGDNAAAFKDYRLSYIRI